MTQSNLFHGASASELEILISSGVQKVYEPHTSIYHAGTPNAKLFLLLKGSCEISFVFTNPRQADHFIHIPVEILGPHSLWGYTSLLEPGKQYPYHVHARGERVEAVEFPVLKILELMKGSAARADSIFYQLARIQSERSRQRQRTTAILIGAATILSQQPPAMQLDELIKLLAVSFGSDKALAAAFIEKDKSLKIISAYGYYQRLAGLNELLQNDVLLSGIYSTREPLLMSSKDFKPEYRSIPYARPGMIITPIFDGTNILGALACFAKKDGEFTENDLLVLSSVSPMVVSMLRHHDGGATGGHK